MEPFDAVILAGGRGRRLGGADKPGLVVGDRSLAASALSAVAEAERVIMVGPLRRELHALRPGGGLVFVREEPPGAGPVPALRRGIAEVTAPWVAVLAADMPFLRTAHVARLRAAARRGGPAGGSGPGGGGGPSGPSGRSGPRGGGGPGGGGGHGGEDGPGGEGTAVMHLSGAVMVDEEGRPQWLAGCWRTAVLRTAAGAYRGQSLHGLLAPLRPAEVWPDPEPDGPAPWLDCDTDEDLRSARELLSLRTGLGVTSR